MIDPNQIANALIKAGHDWADQNAAADALTRATKSMRAKCFLEAKGNNEERKARAETDPEYLEMAQRAEDASRAALKAKVRYDTLKTKVELIRTVESTKRAEMGMR